MLFYSISASNEKLYLKKISMYAVKSFTHCFIFCSSWENCFTTFDSYKSYNYVYYAKDYKRITTKSTGNEG
jgi:hypothetical protein